MARDGGKDWGPGWWEASDGNWYPPPRPGSQPESPIPPAFIPVPGESFVSPSPLDRERSRGGRRGLFIGLCAALLLATLILVLILVVLVLAKSARNRSAAVHTITGAFSLHDTENPLRTGSACSGTGGFSDIGAGTSVSVTNADGRLIATGQLGDGTAATTFVCVFGFSVADVPDSAFYKIEIAHRGELPYSRDQMVAMDWSIRAEL